MIEKGEPNEKCLGKRLEWRSTLFEKFKQVTVDDNPAGIRWIKLVI